jgi:hypothetical protein
MSHHLTAMLNTLFYSIPLSHHVTNMINTCHSLLLCPTVPPSQYNAKYMLLSFSVSHCPTITMQCQIHVTLFYCVPLSHCPTVSLACQIHVTLFYCVPLSHCLTAMANTCHSLLLCPTVPPSQYNAKYMLLSCTVSHCPNVSQACQIHVTLFYCVPLSHCLTAMTNTCYSLLLCPTVPPSH